MDIQKKFGLGVGLLSVGIILFLVCSSFEFSHTWDSILSFLAGAAVGASLPLIVMGFNARRKK